MIDTGPPTHGRNVSGTIPHRTKQGQGESFETKDEATSDVSDLPQRYSPFIAMAMRVGWLAIAEGPCWPKHHLFTAQADRSLSDVLCSGATVPVLSMSPF